MNNKAPNITDVEITVVLKLSYLSKSEVIISNNMETHFNILLVNRQNAVTLSCVNIDSQNEEFIVFILKFELITCE